MKIGYARVFTDLQGESLAFQSDALEAAGCSKVYLDAISGAKSARPGLTAALEGIRDDDVLVVTDLHRLGRTALDTLSTIADLAERGVAMQVLEPQLDTRTKDGRLMLTIMSGLAEWQRDLLSERTRAGVAHARAQGRVAGPKPKLSRDQVDAVRAAVEHGEPIAAVARSAGVSRTTIYRALTRAQSG